LNIQHTQAFEHRTARNMILIKHIKNLQETLAYFRSKGKTTGFVPTMGALHEGHISLVNKCNSENDISIVSIFVNPAQFNNKADLEKYPVTIEADIDKLEKANCDILFLPSVAEMYPAGEVNKHYDLGFIETVLEGKYRPGHFQGVCIIVDKLLQAVQPDNLYMGRKDYQQCMVIRKMLELTHSKVKLHVEDTVREPDGLAMSSRNLRLNNEERQTALRIIEALQMIREKITPGNLQHLKQNSVAFLEKYGYKTDYVEIADALTLEPKDHWDGKEKIVALVAAYLNEVRLIDNILL
jgi:pantoate--beta-alanine ligase